MIDTSLAMSQYPDGRTNAHFPPRVWLLNMVLSAIATGFVILSAFRRDNHLAIDTLESVNILLMILIL